MPNKKSEMKTYIWTLFFAAVLFIMPSIAHADITTGLVGHWKFDEESGTNADDSSSSNFDGTISGSPTLGATGQVGTAFTFGTGGQKVVIGDHYGTTITATSTISAWVKPSGANANNGYIIHKFSGAAGTFFLRDLGGVWTAAAFNVGDTFGVTASITSSAWQHLVFVYEPSGTVSLYKNGALASSKTSANFGAIVDGTGIDVSIGDRGGNDRPFGGSIDEVRVYNRGLNSSDVSELYAYTGADTSAPVISSVASSTTSTTATITWTTDESASSTVRYGATTSYGTASTSATLSTSHSIVLSGLTASTIYHYRVESGDAAFNYATSSDLTFMTSAVSNQSPTVTVLGDTTLTLPTNYFTATSTSADSDGTIASYLWTEVSSIGATISASTTATATITDLTPGTYTFRLTVTDNLGATASDTAVITVAAGAVASSCPAKKIAVLGSSTSEGLGLSAGQSYVDRLRTYLQTLNASHTVTNYAASGYDTYRIMPTGYSTPVGRPAVDTTRNITWALAFDPDIIIVNMPSNDQASGYDVSETESNFETVVAVARAANVPIFLTTTQPRSDGLMSPTEMARLITVKDWINSTYGIFAMDFWTVFANSDGSLITNPYSQGDGVHINALGHQKLLSRVLANGFFELVCGDTGPTVSLSSPADGARVSGSVSITGDASDDMLISGVQFKRSNTDIGAEDATSTYSTTWDTTAVADGSYSIVAVARDLTGNRATSSARTLVVDNTAPIISNIAPVNATVLPVDTTSTSLTVDTNETSLCRYSTSSGAAFGSMTDFSSTNSTSHSTTISGLGPYTTYNYYVKCQDEAGNTTADSTTSFSVTAPAVTPTATSTRIRGVNSGSSVQNRVLNLRNSGDTLAAQNLINQWPQLFGPQNIVAPGASVRDLQLGSDGEDVRILQSFLIAKAAGPVARDLAQFGATGHFGLYTQNALSEYQKINGIVPAVGYLGPLTRARIALDVGPPSSPSLAAQSSGTFNTNLYQGSQSADVTRLQQALSKIPDVYPSKSVTGFFGPLTAEAVGKFQLKYGIVTSAQDVGYGGFGPVTRAKLNSVLAQ